MLVRKQALLWQIRQPSHLNSSLWATCDEMIHIKDVHTFTQQLTPNQTDSRSVFAPQPPCWSHKAPLWVGWRQCAPQKRFDFLTFEYERKTSLCTRVQISEQPPRCSDTASGRNVFLIESLFLSLHASNTLLLPRITGSQHGDLDDSTPGITPPRISAPPVSLCVCVWMCEADRKEKVERLYEWQAGGGHVVLSSHLSS